MGSIRERTSKDGKKSWNVGIRKKNHAFMSKTFYSLEEAELWEKQIENSLNQINKIKFKVSDMLERYSLEILPTKNGKIDELRHIKFWNDHLGNEFIDEITSLKIELTANLLYNTVSKATNKNLSPETRRKYLGTLQFIYQKAMLDWKWIDYNPVLAVPKHKKEQKKIPIHLSDDHKKAFTDRIHLELKERQMSFASLANLMGVSKSTVQYMLDNQTNVTLETMIRCLKALKLNFSFEFRFADEK